MAQRKNHRRMAGAVAVLVLAGCGSTGQHSVPRMMSPGNGAGAGGMSGGSRYAQQTCTAPARLPGTVVTVTLADMGMSRMMTGIAPMGAHMTLHATTTAVAAGPVTFIAENFGWRTHELVVLSLAAGSAAGQRVPGPDGKVDETGSLGEASANCAAGTGDGIPSGAVGWVTVTLPTGRYELICNLANHYTDGMSEEITVTGN